MLDNMAVTKKTSFGFGLVLGLLVVVGVAGLFSLWNTSSSFGDYRALALGTNSSGSVQANLLMARMQVKDFLIRSDAAEIEEFHEYLDATNQFLKEALGYVEDPAMRQDLEEAAAQVAAYKGHFETLTKHQAERDRLVNGIANVVGPQIGEKLSQILVSARRDDDAVAAFHTAEALQHLLSGRLYVMKFLDDNAAASAERVRKEFRGLDGSFAALDKELQDAERRRLLGEAVKQADQYAESFEGIVKAIDARNELVVNQLDRIGPLVAQKIDDVKLAIKSEQDTLGPALVRANNVAMIVIGAIGFVAFLVGFFTRRMTLTSLFANQEETDRCIAEVREIASKASAGQLDVRGNPESYDIEGFKNVVHGINGLLDAVVKPIEDTVGEVERLVQAAVGGQLDERGRFDNYRIEGFKKIVAGINQVLDAVLDPIQEASDVLDSVAAKDLSARVQGNYQGDHQKIKNALNKAIQNLDSGLEQVAAGATQVASAASQISSSSQSLAQGASEQASSIEEVTASLQEMSASSQQNADHSREALKYVEASRSASREGVQSMEKLTNAIERIRTSADDTARIVKTIDEIAFQTNLLALNAAVEAARAGDAGKGFAVVAEEVRNLAMRSADAAKDTAQMIEESVKSAEDGVKINEEVLDKLRQIDEHVGRVSGVMEEIASASQEQNEGVQQTHTAVEQMNEVTQQAAATAEESASAAEELTSQSSEMTNLVASFTLSSAKSGAPRKPAAKSGGSSQGASAKSAQASSANPAPAKAAAPKSASSEAESASSKEDKAHERSKHAPEYEDKDAEALLASF